MIKINESSSLEIKELEEMSSFIVLGVWIEYGINGILPRVQLDLQGFPDNIDFTTFTIKLIVDNKVIMNCTASIESINRNDTKLTISAYLVKNLEFVRSYSSKSYSSIKELVNSLWEGENEMTIPEQSDLYLCQMNEINHIFLSRVLCCSSAEQSFYYDLFNKIKPVQLTGRQVDHDFTTKDKESLITVKNRDMSSIKNRYNFFEEFTDVVAENSITVAGNMIYFGDPDHIQLEENGIRTGLWMNSAENSFAIEYINNDELEIGDILKLPFTDTVTKTCMILSTKMYFNSSGLQTVSNVKEYDRQ